MPDAAIQVGRFSRVGRRTALVVFAPCLAVLAFSGCKPVGPNYSKPATTPPPAYKETGASSVVPPVNPQGGSWKPADPSDSLLKGKWWEIYQDPQLNKLEERVTTDNLQLKQALDRYQAAHDQITVANAGMYPTLTAVDQIARTRNSYNSPNAPSSDSKIMQNMFMVEGVASWEPDFFGRVRRSIEAARANAQGSAADMANLDLTLHASLATFYYALRGLDSQANLLTHTVADLQSQYELTQHRLAGGVATAVDVSQAQTQLNTVRAQLVELGVARAQYEHAIATLGSLDISTFSIPPSPLDQPLPKVPTGVPSQLLERRPDIALAERGAAAANAQIGITKAAFYPSIVLGGPGGFSSKLPGTLIQGPAALWSLGENATWLLFDAGKRRALNDAARLNYDAQVNGYRSTILLAFQDVENQLSTLRILEQESAVSAEAVASAQHTFDLASQRYKGGVTSYLEVLTAEQTLIQNQTTAINLQSRQFAASVGLVRSLGGGWDSSQLPK